MQNAATHRLDGLIYSPRTIKLGDSNLLAFLRRAGRTSTSLVIIADQIFGRIPAPAGTVRFLGPNFPGLSSIVAGSGDVLAILASEEDKITAMVTLGNRPDKTALLPQGRWTVRCHGYALAWPLSSAYVRVHMIGIAGGKRSLIASSPGGKGPLPNHPSR